MQFPKYPKLLQISKNQKKSFLLRLFLIVTVFIVVIISLNIYLPSFLPRQIRVLGLVENKTLLFLGIDEILKTDEKDIWKGRSDTVGVISFNPYTNELNILNIPRDTKIRIRGHGVEKINYLNAKHGPLYIKKHIEQLLHITINNYVVLNLTGLSNFVDKLGGVIINIPQRMEYHDYAGMLDINLFPGEQLLNGDQVIQFVRYRHDTLGDIGRIQRQQILARAIVQKLLDPLMLTRLPVLLHEFKGTILTDLKTSDMLKILNFVRNVDAENQKSAILPGKFGQFERVSYWIPDRKETKEVIEKFFGRKKKVRKEKVVSKDIKIFIYDGAHNKRLLKKLTNRLKKYGYTVLNVSKYEEQVRTTKIYAQNANSEIANMIKDEINDLGEIIVGNLGPPEADVTILAGMDLVYLKAVVKN